MMSGLANKKVALVGGAGFIGHHVALKLKAMGADVIIVDSLSVNNLLSFSSHYLDEPNAPLYIDFIQQRLALLREANIKLLVDDARDYHRLVRVLDNFKPNIIVHLAGVAHAGRSNKDPFSTFDHSMRTLENALDYSRGAVEHFIYFSSSMVYGHFEGGFVTEDSYCNPLGVYAALKFGGEKLVIAYNQAFDLPYTIIRPSALYGERCVSRRVGQMFIEEALKGHPVTVHGDGSDHLDFTYIDDFVQGLIKVMENKASHNEIFNLTYGASHSLNDLVAILQEHFPDLQVNYKPKDKLTPDRGTLSVDKARKLIGYEPQYPPSKGFPRYIEWYKSIYGADCARLRQLLCRTAQG